MAVKQSVEKKIHIIGAGISGLSAAMTFARAGISCNLISVKPSERAQSIMAEGGINGALNTMGEQDTTQAHFFDTMKAGLYIADEEAVTELTENAPKIIKMLDEIGVPFHKENGVLQQRNFGGQKNKRTAYAKSSTGKCIMSALIQEIRKYEAQDIVCRYNRHEFVTLLLDEKKRCVGVKIYDLYNGNEENLYGIVIMATGGMHGLFPKITTGTTDNNSCAVARVFSQGMQLGNLEMIQYHPTTIGIAGKRCLVSEAARGEGARLFVEKEGKPWYFMEEKFPELGNLMPRDVVSREIFFCVNSSECGDQVYLDMRDIPKALVEKKLSDLYAEVKHYIGINPQKNPIPIAPAIHYFMGGIKVNKNHQTNIEGVFAIGECCCQYHGANRLGGNSLLGAAYSGVVAAQYIKNHLEDFDFEGYSEYENLETLEELTKEVRPRVAESIGNILTESLGIIRNQQSMEKAIQELEMFAKNQNLNKREQERIILGKAVLESAIFRKESRGAHYREDYPKTDENLQKMTITSFKEEVEISYV